MPYSHHGQFSYYIRSCKIVKQPIGYTCFLHELPELGGAGHHPKGSSPDKAQELLKSMQPMKHKNQRRVEEQIITTEKMK